MLSARGVFIKNPITLTAHGFWIVTTLQEEAGREVKKRTKQIKISCVPFITELLKVVLDFATRYQYAKGWK